jgi:hypothetical protein
MSAVISVCFPPFDAWCLSTEEIDIVLSEKPKKMGKQHIILANYFKATLAEWEFGTW